MKKFLTKFKIYNVARDCIKNFPYLLFRIVGHIPSHIIRMIFYKLIFKMKIGKGSKIYKNLDCYAPSKIVIGIGTAIGNDAFLDGRAGITIGDNVNLSGWVKIFTRQHDMDDEFFKVVGGPVKIGNKAAISTCSIILPNITIGEGAVVMAGAVVTKNVEPFHIVGGVPARFVRRRSNKLSYDGRNSHPIPFH